MHKILITGVLVCLLASCRNNANNTAQSTQNLNSAFVTAWNGKDTAKIDSFLAADVVFVQADRHYSGKGDVVRQWVQATLPSISNVRTNPISSASDDHLAYQAGNFTVDVITPGKPAASGSGNYIFVWKKQADESWRLGYIQLEDLPLQDLRR